jgi:hypothetical protein
MKEFTEITNRMDFNVEFGDSVIKPLFSTQLNLDGEAKSFSVAQFNNESNFCIVVDSNLIITDQNLILHTIIGFSDFKTASTVISNIQHIYGTIDSSINFRLNDGTNLFDGDLSVGDWISTSPVINTLNSGEQLSINNTRFYK